MKKKTGTGIFMAIGGIDPKLLEKVEDMEQKPKTREKKRPNIWVAVACCALLFGAGSEMVRDFVSGSQIRWQEGGQAVFSGENISKKVYREDDDGFFYTFQGENMDVTDFCSEENYILDVQVDANGTGYVMAVGGGFEGRGYYLFYFESATFYLGEGVAEPYDLLEMTDKSIHQGEVDSAYPHLIWNHHATHFLGYELPREFFAGNLPDLVENDMGIGKKIGDTLYFVEGNDINYYTEWEMGIYLKFTLEQSIDWSGGLNWTYFPDENLFEVHLLDPWSEELEIQSKKILDDLGYPYELKFIG